MFSFLNGAKNWLPGLVLPAGCDESHKKVYTFGLALFTKFPVTKCVAESTGSAVASLRHKRL